MNEQSAPVATSDQAGAVRWSEQVERGRYDLAAQAYRLSGGADAGVENALEGLSDVLSAIRDKSYGRARNALERITERPEGLDWEALESDLEGLSEAAAALDRREAEVARSHLAGVDGQVYPAETATLLGTLAVYEGESETARQRFEQALELDPNHYRALTNLGNIMLEDGDVDGAIDAYERAIRLNDAFANAHHNLGVALRRKGHLARSVQALKRAQREAGRREADEARARLGSGRRGQSAVGRARSFRWLIWAGIVGAVIWIVSSR